MKKVLNLLLILFVSVTTQAQNLEIITDSIKEEAMRLYHTEKFAWLTSDIVQKEAKKYQRSLTGYVSYNVADTYKAIFYHQNEDKTRIEFTGSWEKKSGQKNISRIDTLQREPNAKEIVIIGIKDTLIELITNSPSFEKFRLPDIRYNISIIEKEFFLYAYLLPSSSKNAYFGGDFICKFSLEGDLLKVIPQHKGLIRMNYPFEQRPIAHVHNHLNDMSAFITVTDICQAKLYGKMATGITNYIVMSESYKSEFNIETNELKITKR